jgi:hypothetical protein
LPALIKAINRNVGGLFLVCRARHAHAVGQANKLAHFLGVERSRPALIVCLVAVVRVTGQLVTRYEYHIENSLGMVSLGCMRIMLRYL